MPVARRRGLGHIALRDDDGDPDYTYGDPDSPSPTTTAFPTVTMSKQGKKSDPTTTESAIQVTMTFNRPTPSGSNSVLAASSGPVETVVVTIPPPPPHHGNGISQTTEHLLIAAGSIGATIIVVMILFALHTMRKRGITFAEAIKRGKNAAWRRSRAGPTPPPKSQNYTSSSYSWDRNAPFEQGSLKGTGITTPQTAMTRTRSDASDRPLMLQRNQSLNRQPSNRSLSPAGSGQRSFLLDSPPRRMRSNNSHNRDNSETASSPVLPLQTQRQSATTRNTRSLSDTSELVYPEPPVAQPDPLPAPPTFRQFLFNRRSIAYPRTGGPMISHFSWTNSNAPQTPHDPTRDTYGGGVPGLPRESIMTSRSSLVRFRTVDSWVNQQASRFEEQKLREQLRAQNGNSMLISQSDDEREEHLPEPVPAVPEIPILPLNVQKLKKEEPSRPTSILPTPSGLVGKNIKHERHDTNTTVTTTTDPIFRQHPGTEVRFSTRSLVPSEILNNKMKPSVL